MTDDASKPAPTPEPPKQDAAPTEPSPPPPPVDEPWRTQVWVRGGTTTSRYDNLVAAQHADAEARRKEQDDDRRAVREEGAKMFSHQFSDNLDEKVLLLFDDTKLGVRMEQLCELLTEESDGSRAVIICCPDCVSRGVPSELAQMRVPEKHRRWNVDTKNKGKLGHYVDAWGRRQVYISAGDIVDTEILRCSGAFCTFSCVIDHNVIRRV